MILPNGSSVDEAMVRDTFSLTPNRVPARTEELFLNAVDLRDGQQAERYSPTVEESVEFARKLVRSGTQGIEAGNAPAGDTEQKKIHAIAENVGWMELPRPSQYGVHPRITSLARLCHADVVASLQSVQGAPNHGVHAYMAHSEIQFPFKFEGLRKTYDLSSADFEAFITKVVLPTIDREFQYIKDTDPQCHIRYSPEDWTRTRPEIAKMVILKAVQCGANCINLPDTLGVGNPFVVAEAVHEIRTFLDEHGFQHVTIAWHGHNDVMATANAMGALIGGAREFDSTFLGTGERRGNLSTEEFTLMLDLQRAFLERTMGVKLTDTMVRERMMETSLACVKLFHRNGIPEGVAIVSDKATEQGAGVHQAAQAAGEKAGVKNVYVPFDPTTYGARTHYVIRPESGAGGLSQVMRYMGLPFRESDLPRFAARMKQVGEVHRTDLREDEVRELIYIPTVVELMGTPFMNGEVDRPDDRREGKKYVKFQTSDGRAVEGVAENEKEGAINAFVSGLKRVWKERTGETIEVEEPGIESHSKGGQRGSDVPLVATITLRSNGLAVIGTGEHSDSEKAGIFAVQNAANRLWALRSYQRNLRTTGNGDENV